MSSIFCLGYEFETELDRDIFVAERTAELEINQLFLSKKLDSFFEQTETKSKESGGGLFGLIKRGFQVIINMLAKIGKTIKNFLFGKKEDVDLDVTVEYKKNPKHVISACDKAVSDDVNMLNQVLNGQKGLDDVKRMQEEHENVLDKIAPFAGTLASLGAAKLVDSTLISKWEGELSDAMVRHDKDVSSYAKDVSMTSKKKNKNEKIDECVELIFKDMQMHTSTGSNMIMDLMKKQYVKKEVKKKIGEEVDGLETNKGGILSRIGKRSETKRLKKEASRLRKEVDQIDKNSKKNERVDAEYKNAYKDLDRARSERYTDRKPHQLDVEKPAPKKNNTD